MIDSAHASAGGPRRFGGLNGYGFTADPEGHCATPAHRFLVGATRAPRAWTAEKFVVVGDQKQTSRCTGFGTGGAIATTFAARGAPIVQPSFNGIYTLGRCIDRAPGGRAGLKDEGAMPNQVIRGLSEWGVPLERDWPSTEAGVNDEPDFAKLLGASGLELRGAYLIDSTGAQFVEDFCTALGSRHACVAYAIDVDQAFEDYDGSSVLGAASGYNLGGHWTYACGYDRTLSGDVEGTGVNSWGEAWGSKGLYRFGRKFMERMQCAYVLDVRQATAAEVQ